MHIRFMGTGAADFSPLLKTTLQNCLDCNARRSSSLLIEEKFLIDCGPHVPDSFRIQGISMGQVTDLFLTHLHSDHCDWEKITELASAVKTESGKKLRIWYRQGAEIKPVAEAVFSPMEVGQTVQVDGLTAKVLAANHTAWPLHFDMEYGGKRLFYGCDGAWLLYDTFYAMRGREYDRMILDATVGDYNGDYRLGEHNSIPMIRLMAETFRNEKVLAKDGQIWLSHLARTLHKSHEEIVKVLAKDGFHVAYDGLTVADNG